MKYSIASLSLCLVFGSSDVGAIDYIQPPPTMHDKPTLNVSVQYASKSRIKRLCNNPIALGCAYAHSKGCTIVVPPGTGTESMLYRHERAHCNGWPKYHPWSVERTATADSMQQEQLQLPAEPQADTQMAEPETLVTDKSQKFDELELESPQGSGQRHSESALKVDGSDQTPGSIDREELSVPPAIDLDRRGNVEVGNRRISTCERDNLPSWQEPLHHKRQPEFWGPRQQFPYLAPPHVIDDRAESFKNAPSRVDPFGQEMNDSVNAGGSVGRDNSSQATEWGCGPLELISVERVPPLELASPQDFAKLQGRLLELGYLKDRVDGIWGPKSRAALRDYQSYHGLPIDSSWNTALSSLFSDSAKSAPVGGSPGRSRSLNEQGFR